MCKKVLIFDDYCIKFELDSEDKQSKEMYKIYTENVQSDENIFNANSDVKVQGKDTLFD